MQTLFKYLLASSLLWLSSVVSAAMIVEQSVIHFEPDKPSRQDVLISNPDKEPLYIQVEILGIENPGETNEKRTLIQNPKASKFLVTPNKLVIQPGQKKRVRLVNLAPLGDKERVFRVNLKPISPEIESDTTAIKVLIGFQLLVLMQPNKPQPNIVGKRNGNKLTLSNEGNTNVLMHRGEQCDVPQKGETVGQGCTPLPTKRLYPGNSITIDLNKSTPAQYLLSTASVNQRKVF